MTTTAAPGLLASAGRASAPTTRYASATRHTGALDGGLRTGGGCRATAGCRIILIIILTLIFIFILTINVDDIVGRSRSRSGALADGRVDKTICKESAHHVS